jgi:hypothetical protein
MLARHRACKTDGVGAGGKAQRQPKDVTPHAPALVAVSVRLAWKTRRPATTPAPLPARMDSEAAPMVHARRAEGYEPGREVAPPVPHAIRQGYEGGSESEAQTRGRRGSPHRVGSWRARARERGRPTRLIRNGQPRSPAKFRRRLARPSARCPTAKALRSPPRRRGPSRMRRR